jgi:mediator of replication checkpoint protein 1
MLTPGQKIKAMMAEFDTDSESDSQATKKKTTIPKLDFGRNNTSTTTETRPPQSNNDSSDDSDDTDDIVRPKGRMAARMQGAADESTEQGSAFSRLSNALRSEKEQAQRTREKSPAPAHDSSDDDLPVNGAKRRNHAQVQRSPTPADSPANSRADSPLFVSSPAATRPQSEALSDKVSGSDNEGPSKAKNARFLELIAQKRKEREERERVEAEEKAARRAKMEHFSSNILSGEESEADDPGSAHKLSQKARQPRKASKKALEEMSRETQRMSRNMQLAHQAQTKKKITKESLFARFNFMQPDPPPAEPAAANSSSAANSQNSSDIEGQKNETPRTSPVLGPADTGKSTTTNVSAEGQTETVEEQADIEMTDLPTLEEAIADTPVEPKATDALVAPGSEVTAKSPRSTVQPKQSIRRITPSSVRVLMSRQEVAQHQQDGSDSDELEVITSPAKARRIAAFENLPCRQMQESASMTRLKALAHLTSPNRKMSSMSSAELSASLLYKARQQAAKDRRERIEELRAKGVVIETAEERAAMEDNVEDLVEKARQEADDIAREERAARRKAKGLDADDDEEDDDDYAFSGSDDDASGEDEDEDEEKSVRGETSMFEQEADEADESSGDESEAAASEPEIETSGSRRRRRTRVVSDDEDEDENEQQIPSTPVRPPSHVPQSAERPNFPGMGTPNMSMGLTQAFAGTLADENASQPGSGTIPFSLPDPGRPVPRLRAEESEILVKDSQEQNNETDFMPAYNANVNRVSESPAGHGFSNYSQIPDPTQDEGFVFSPFDPSKRFRGTPPVSTIDTVIVGQSQSPVVERKGRKIRRGRAANLSAVEEQNEDEAEFEINANAFNVMKKATKKTTTPYDKKNSKAKGVVDEAAEESEDEYAGIGGASDDSDGEEDVRDLNMINDNSGEVVDEKELAALNAYVWNCPLISFLFTNML